MKLSQRDDDCHTTVSYTASIMHTFLLITWLNSACMCSTNQLYANNLYLLSHNLRAMFLCSLLYDSVLTIVETLLFTVYSPP